MLSARMDLRSADSLARTPRRQFVASEQSDVGTVDEDLLLGHTHREQVVDRFVGDGVAVAVPSNETIDAAHPVDDPCGVVGVSRKRAQMRHLLRKQFDR